MVTIVDPHLKREEQYRVYTESRDKGLLVKNKDGNDFDGWCWPGKSCLIRYTFFTFIICKFIRLSLAIYRDVTFQVFFF